MSTTPTTTAALLAELETAKAKLVAGRLAVTVNIPGGESITYNATDLAAIDQQIINLQTASGTRRRGCIRFLG